MSAGLSVIEPDDHGLRADLASESAVLGYLLDGRADPKHASELWSLLGPEDFYRPAHQVIAQVLRRLYLNGEAIDPVRVLHELVQGDLLRSIGGDPGYLHTLMQRAAIGAQQAGYHCNRIVETARQRDAVVLMTRTLQRLGNPDVDLLPLLSDLRDEVEGLSLVSSTGTNLGTVDFIEFLEQPDTPVEFVIDGLLGRREKAMFTGGEGLGKSTLMRQIALCAASGLQPFTRELCEPKRVLWLDAENHEDNTRRLMRRVYQSVLEQGRAITPGDLTLKHLQHFDLLNDKDVTWLMRVVTEHRPDLIYLGPLYQCVGGSLNDEDVAQRVVRTLNRVCAIGNAGMVIEAHAGHGKGSGGQREWRPRGSSVLLGWPDFGFGLGISDDPAAEVNRLVDVHSWRGERHVGRQWPKQLSAGGRWPFDGWGW